MTEEGLVIEIKDDIAKVSIDKKDECSKCGMCLFPKNASFITLDCVNQAGAVKGDTVIIERRENTKLLSALLVFLVPLVLICISVFLGLQVIKNELWVLGLSAISVVAWFIALSFIDKRFFRGKNTDCKIIKITKKNK